MSVYRMETEEDMAGYFDATAGHGVTAVFTNSSSQQSTINIILNNEYFEIELGTNVEGTKPTAYCRSVDAPNAVFGNTLNAFSLEEKFLMPFLICEEVRRRTKGSNEDPELVFNIVVNCSQIVRVL